MSVTLRQIAKELGVATSTVSRVLAGKTDGTPITRHCIDRILEAAERMNYRANASARAVRTGKTSCVAVLISKGPTYITAEVLGHVHNALDALGMHLALARVPDEQLSSAMYVPRLLREFVAEGVLVYYPDYEPPGTAELLRRFGVPAIWMNVKRADDCVYPDDLDAGRRATEHLLKLGHRRIAYLDFSHAPDDTGQHYSARDRQAGYEQAMRQAGLEPAILRKYVPSEARLDVCQEWLTGAAATACVTYAPSAATPLLCAMLKTGKQPGRDLSIVTFDHNRDASIGFKVTTFTVPHREVAHASVERLSRRIADLSLTLEPLAVPFGYLEGNTCQAV
jgi:LacI family transcriptional regulator